MTVQAQLSDASIVVSPGGEETVRLSVRNLGTDVETFAIVPSGFCAGWATVSPATLALLPDEEQVVLVTLQPPRAASVSSGESVLALRVVPHGRPTEVAVVEATVTVLAFANRRLTVAQPVQVGTRGAVYDVVLENHGNERANCRLSLTDMSGRLVGRFDPPSLAADAGQSTSSRLRIRTKGTKWGGGSMSTRFSVQAEQDGQRAAITTGTFVQSPVVSSRAVGAVAGFVLAAAVIVGAWTLVVRPAIDDAASDAVATQLSTSSTTVAAPDTTTTGDGSDGNTSASTVPPSPGSVVNVRLPLTAAPGDSASEQIDAGGASFEISDLIVQNPAEDLGILTISADDEVLFTFDLETVYGFEQVELRTPIVVPAGAQLVVDLQCDAPGDPAAPECTPAVFVSGRSL